MTRDELLKRIGKINIGRSHGKRAPHKPLLLLLALGRTINSEERLVSYRKIEPQLKDLLRAFGKPSTTLHPEQPFGRLGNDGLWEIPGVERLARTGSGDCIVGDLREHDAQGGFPEEVFSLLLSRPEVVLEVAEELLQRHFPLSLHDEICEMVGLPKRWAVQDKFAVKRDPAFRPNVLREYERRCAVCEFDVRLGDELIGLEAAHIRWHSHEGPDNVTNGLALCGLHHKALDKGALGLEIASSGLEVVISSELIGLTTPVRWFLDYHRKPLRLPRNQELAPMMQYVRWHQRNVFRHPCLT